MLGITIKSKPEPKVDIMAELNTPKSKMMFAITATYPANALYEGTVPPATIAKRRAANKVARRQRKVNRHGR